MVAEGEFGDTWPLTGSHEPAGTVAKMGSESTKLGKFKIGDRIAALATIDPCGTLSTKSFSFVLLRSLNLVR